MSRLLRLMVDWPLIKLGVAAMASAIAREVASKTRLFPIFMIHSGEVFVAGQTSKSSSLCRVVVGTFKRRMEAAARRPMSKVEAIDGWALLTMQCISAVAYPALHLIFPKSSRNSTVPKNVGICRKTVYRAKLERSARQR